MNNQLTNFVQSCSQGGTCRVTDFLRSFQARLTPAERLRWGRTRVVSQMARAGYGIGFDSTHQAHFVGVALPMKVDERGRLALAVA